MSQPMNTGRFTTIPSIIDQHAEEATFLWLLRDAAVSDPGYDLNDLADLDNRVEAHIDGLRIAGEDGWSACIAGLEIGEPGEVFVASVLAYESGDGKRIDAVLGAALEEPENFRALVSALGWIEYSLIDDFVGHLLSANSSDYRRVGIAACAVHRRDPGELLHSLVRDESVYVQMRALKAVGELNRRDLLGDLRTHWQSDHEGSRFWSTWSSVLLGDADAVKPLMVYVNFATRYRLQALALLMRVLAPDDAKNWLRGLWQEADQRRYTLKAAGFLGDPQYIPALIEQLAVPELTRVAGEAFSLITGADLAHQNLEGERPEDFEAGPSDDEDEELAWPDPNLVRQWWESNKQQFSAGTRYLCGQPISVEHCNHVLKTGYQRQRMAAATELALLQPDSMLIEVRSPGFRQLRVDYNA